MKRPRMAVTMLELLMVISIITLLMGLLLPAVQAARETARRVKCSSNLRTIGLAVTNYEVVYGNLPIGLRWSGQGLRFTPPRFSFIGTHDHSQNGTQWEADGFHASFFPAILPHMERAATYGRWNFSVPVSAPANREARGTSVAEFLCPTDTFNQTLGAFQGGNWARGNYGVNAGPNGRCLRVPMNIPLLGTVGGCSSIGIPSAAGVDVFPNNPITVRQAWGSGIAGINRVFRLSEVTDGLSQTVAIDELRAGLNESDRRGVWGLPMIGSSITFGHGRWNFGGIPPNICRAEADQIQDCRAVLMSAGLLPKRQCMPCSEVDDNSYMATSRSLHPGGVQVLHLDGSSRFVSHFVDLKVWTSSHTRNGNELESNVD